MTDIVITPTQRLVTYGWMSGMVTIRRIELLVKTGYITRDQADMIYTYPRLQTSIAIADPWSPEVVEKYRSEQSSEATT